MPEKCSHRATARAIEKGEVLFREGDRSRAVYFIARGSFTVVRRGKQVATLGPESVVGEMGALFDRPRVATVIAAEDSEVMEFKDFGEKLGSTQQRYALRSLQEIAVKSLWRDTTRDFLRTASPLFRDASEDLLDLIISGSEHAHFQAGEVVSEEGDERMALHIVQEGLLEVRSSANSYTAFIGPGELVGEMALIFGQRGRQSLRAVKPTTALVLDRAEFALILSQFPKERDKIVAMAEWRLEEMGLHTGLLIARN